MGCEMEGAGGVGPMDVELDEALVEEKPRRRCRCQQDRAWPSAWEES